MLHVMLDVKIPKPAKKYNTMKILLVLAIVVQHCVLSRVCSHLLLPLLCP